MSWTQLGRKRNPICFPWIKSHWHHCLKQSTTPPMDRIQRHHLRFWINDNLNDGSGGRQTRNDPALCPSSRNLCGEWPSSAFAFGFGLWTLSDKPWFRDSMSSIAGYPYHHVGDREWWYYQPWNGILPFPHHFPIYRCTKEGTLTSNIIIMIIIMRCNHLESGDLISPQLYLTLFNGDSLRILLGWSCFTCDCLLKDFCLDCTIS